MTVDKVRCIGCQEHSRTHQILRCSPTACGRLGDDELIEGVAAAIRLPLPQRGGLGRGDVSGADAVALDVGFAVFRADVPGQHFQAALGRGIGGNRLPAQLAHHGADIDDLAVSLFQHAGNDGLCADKRTNQVDVHHLTEFLGTHFGHRNPLDNTGVVHQNIHTAQIRFDLFHQLLHLGFIRHICDVALGIDSLGGIIRKCLVKVRLAAAVKGDFRACARQRLRNGKPNAVSTAGDKGNFAFQRKKILHIHERVLLFSVLRW